MTNCIEHGKVIPICLTLHDILWEKFFLRIMTGSARRTMFPLLIYTVVQIPMAKELMVDEDKKDKE